MDGFVPHVSTAALCLVGLLQVSETSPHRDQHSFDAQDILTCDVCIIGGGATGTYAAVRLSQDMGKSVLVVEKSDRLGGHAHTYIDPATQCPVDYGVLAYHNLSVVTNFFARFNVALTKVPLSSPFTTNFVDLRNGEVVPGYTPPDPTAALGKLAVLLQQYPYLPGGYNLPDPVPADLLLPFGDYVTKYGIQAALPLFLTFANGVGDLLKSPALYVFQNFGLPQLNSLFTNGFLTSANHDNSEVYRKASALLGSDVLYRSTLVDIKRNNNGTQLVTVQTPTGQKLIKAKKLLVTIPPILDNLGPFHLDQQEHSLFKQWLYTTYHCGIIRNGLPNNINVANTSIDTLYNIPRPPYVENFDFSGVPGIHNFRTISDMPQTKEQVQALIMSSLEAMGEAGTFPASTPSIEALSNHTPTQMRVSVEAIENGFYNDLYALQGRNGTFWTGAAWAPDDSALLWAFTERVLPQVVATLE